MLESKTCGVCGRIETVPVGARGPAGWLVREAVKAGDPTDFGRTTATGAEARSESWVCGPACASLALIVQEIRSAEEAVIQQCAVVVDECHYLPSSRSGAALQTQFVPMLTKAEELRKKWRGGR
jgi:hypothetical protein